MIDKQLTGILRKFFPKDGYNEEKISKQVDSKDLIVETDSLINYLQRALLDETLLEVELGGIKRVYFSRLLDIPSINDSKLNQSGDPDHDDSSSRATAREEKGTQRGDYLHETERVVITPLEPAEGNYLINTDPRVLLRAHTPDSAIEFCCFFESKIKIDAMPALQISFPMVARQVEGAREYRVKVPDDMDLKINVKIRGSKSRFTTKPMDMSVSGMSLYDPKGKHSVLKAGDQGSIQIITGKMVMLSMSVEVRHVTRLRNSTGLQYIFGISLDLESQSVRSQMERLVATIQRARLRKLAEIEEKYGVNFSGW